MTKTKVTFTIEEDTVVREMIVGDRSNREDKELLPFLLNLGTRVPVDLGWIPPGLRSYTQAGDHAQMVIECPPALNHINWGEHEGGAYETYLLAQPWRVIIGDLYKGNLLGARMFYSPVPFSSPEQPLYHANIPNLNCKGYRDVSVGWICLYHRESWDGWSLGRKAIRLAERCSGVEAYNNANMSGTDGPRFYKEMGQPPETWDPKVWEKKSEEEGVDWILDPDLWIPILVEGRQSQDKHKPNGKPLTLDDAMNGNYKAYYGDKYSKPSIDLRRGKRPDNLFSQCVVETFNRPLKTHITPPPPEVKMVKCAQCHETVPTTVATTSGDTCTKCADDMSPCTACGQLSPGLNFLEDKGYCPSCTDFCICTVCGVGISDGSCIEDEGNCLCEGCAKDNGVGTFCYLCGYNAAQGEVVESGDKSWTLCPGCLGENMICTVCNSLTPEEKMTTTKNLTFACPLCWEACNGCGYPVLKDGTDEEGRCEDCQ